jgi:Spy/CpxP family protein refolding chaperone
MTGTQTNELTARRYPLWALVATVLVLQAFLGVVAGIVIDRYAFHRHHPPAYAMRGGWERGFPMGHGGWGGPRRRMDGGPMGGPRMGGHDGEFGMRRNMVDRLSRELALSPSQRTKLDSVMERQAAAFKKIREETQPRIKALVDSSHAQIDQLLTPEQRAKYAKIMEYHEERFKPRDQ